MQLIDGPIRNYDWGSTTAIAELLGRPVSGRPEAELWLGAHPSAPALVGSNQTPLDQIIAADPIGSLGPETGRRFGSLPFLLKVLAAAAPLSLQAHPSTIQAEAGYAREDAAGVPLDASERSFRDRRHKPELICALTPFRALCGFRPPELTLDVLASIDTPALDPVRSMLRAEPNSVGIRTALQWLLTLEGPEASALVEPVVAACQDESAGPHHEERATAAALGARYPGDAGVVTALLLNLITLKAGEALFLAAGNLHAYLHGTAVEIMASSDNVLRGGLTTKHVDVASLMDVVDVNPVMPEIQCPPLIDGVASYRVPVVDFSLDRIELDGEITISPGPAILLCTTGRVDAGAHVLDQGSAAWVPASDGTISLNGKGTLFRAGVGALR